MNLKDEQLSQAGNDMFATLLDEVKSNDLAVRRREDYYEQAGNVQFRTVPRKRQSYVDCNIFFEILCYGAFGISIAAAPYCIRKRLFTQRFDRSSWAIIDNGISDALYAEIASLGTTFPDQCHADAIASPVQAAKLAFIGYMQNFTDYQADADLIMLRRRAKSPASLGCVLFSERMSQSIDPNLGEKWGAFKTQWIPFAQQILSKADQIAKTTLQ